MAVDPNTLRVILFPADVLRRPSAPVMAITDEIRAVAARMFELMDEKEGIGLAAPQVGLPWAMFITGGRDGDEPRVYVNPVLAEPSEDAEVAEEGCLSIPGVTVEVRRPVAVTISATGLDGKPFTLRRDTTLARVWQHEMDHLNGILIIDKMSPMDRLANRRVIRDLKAAAE